MNTSLLPLDALRREFDGLGDLTWLNWQGVAAGPRSVTRAVLEAINQWRAGTFDWAAWEADAEAARALLGSWLRLPSDNVAIVSSLAEAATTVARGITAASAAAPDRKTIVVGTGEFRSNLFPWLAMQRHGFIVRECGSRDGAISASQVLAALDDSVALVALSDVQSQTGARMDMSRVMNGCTAVGARLFVNATQSAGVLRPELGATRPHFLAGHSYKWQLAPRGAAWLATAHIKDAPIEGNTPNWKNAADPYASLYCGPLSSSDSARRLDASLAWFPWVGARASLELLARHDAEAVERTAIGLAAHCRAELLRRGAHVAGSELPSQLLAVRYASADVARAEQLRLMSRQIAVSARGEWLRIGFHGMNTEWDLERVLEEIRW